MLKTFDSVFIWTWHIFPVVVLKTLGEAQMLYFVRCSQEVLMSCKAFKQFLVMKLTFSWWFRNMTTTTRACSFQTEIFGSSFSLCGGRQCAHAFGSKFFIHKKLFLALIMLNFSWLMHIYYMHYAIRNFNNCRLRWKLVRGDGGILHVLYMCLHELNLIFIAQGYRAWLKASTELY